MKKLILIITIMTSIFMTSCSVNMSKVSGNYAKDMANKMTYAKDSRTGLCFGIVSSRKTMSTDQSGMGIVSVPCEDVESLLAR